MIRRRKLRVYNVATQTLTLRASAANARGMSEVKPHNFGQPAKYILYFFAQI